MDDLIDVADPAWPVLQEELAGSSAAVYVIPGRPGARSALPAPAAGHRAVVPRWLLSGQLAQFYEHLRWPGWQHEVRSLHPSQGIGIYPPLCSEEGMANLPATTRRPVPMTELVGMSTDFCRQFGQRDPGFLGAF